jgi:hypothetical protein
MPFKYNRFRRFAKNTNSKLKPKRDWSDYNKKMKCRGDITLWMSPDVIQQWYINDRVYDGTGAPELYSDFAIITAHEIRQIFHLPLRQCEGFVNALFKPQFGVSAR